MARPKTKTNPKGSGRTPVDVSLDLKKIETMAGYGLTQHNIAHALEINPRTLERKIQKHPEVREAFERGKARAQVNVAHMTY